MYIKNIPLLKDIFMFKKKLKSIIITVFIIIFIFQIIAAQESSLGDVNSDEAINIVDALLIAQYYVGLIPDNFNPESADVSGDDNINIVDALLVAQFYVGLIIIFTGETVNPDAPWDWPERADTLVSFIQQQEELEPVDFILCQEGHGGTLSQILGGGGDTILDLQQRLQAAGLTYHAASIICFQNLNTGGFDIESNFLVGILSKYNILRVEQGEIFCSATPPRNRKPEKLLRALQKSPKSVRST